MSRGLKFIVSYRFPTALVRYLPRLSHENFTDKLLANNDDGRMNVQTSSAMSSAVQTKGYVLLVPSFLESPRDGDASSVARRAIHQTYRKHNLCFHVAVDRQF